jgi:hypothetical protein
MTTFVPRTQRFEPVPLDKEHFARWETLFKQRCLRYGFLDVLENKRQLPPQLSAPEATGTGDDALTNYAIALKAYDHYVYECKRYDYDIIQLTDFFFMCMGPEGMSELELRGDDLSDVHHSYASIKTACTVLIGQEISTLTSQFVSLPWKKHETFKEQTQLLFTSQPTGILRCCGL